MSTVSKTSMFFQDFTRIVSFQELLVASSYFLGCCFCTGFPLGPCSLLFYELPYIVSATFCFSVNSFLDFNLCAAGTVGHFLASHWVCNSQFWDFLFGGTAWLAWMSAGFMKVWSRVSLGFRPMPSSVLTHLLKITCVILKVATLRTIRAKVFVPRWSGPGFRRL